jgi:26S proteasome regulatory subunit N6
MASTSVQIRAQEVFTVEKCKEYIKTAEDENKIFWRQALQARLVQLLNRSEYYTQAAQLAAILVRELKKVDDKDLIIDVQLEESKAYYHLSNLTKARAALTSARTTANSKYVPPRMQAALDLQSGILHAADEHDFKTAYSYFYEAFESFDSVNDTADALTALKYMLLSKIMLDSPDEISAILSGKTALKYTDKNLDAMRAIAECVKKRSLAEFNKSLIQYNDQLQADRVVRDHIRSLSDSMLEKDLCRIIEPYSCVNVNYIASLIGLEAVSVEKKLALMILDKRISGVLQQDKTEGIMLTVYDLPKAENTYKFAIETIHSLGEVVDTLYKKNK